MKAFERLHPLLIFLYFMEMIFVTMFTMHPILLICSFVGSITLTIVLFGFRNFAKSLLFSLPVMIILSLTNPLFVHSGRTILFFLNRNPITLEALIYGICMSVMIASVFYWFKCYNLIMTSDKVVYLFGKTVPKISLLISMIINYVPELRRKYSEINEAQKASGFYSSKKHFNKIRSKMRVLSILITWSLENSVEKADSMNARGYGLKGRTSYSIFRWTFSDSIMFIIFTILTATVSLLLGFGYGDFVYYPLIGGFSWQTLSLILYISLFILALMGFCAEIKENLLWRHLKSKI